jgi:hypothetical protein
MPVQFGSNFTLVVFTMSNHAKTKQTSLITALLWWDTELIQKARKITGGYVTHGVISGE